MPTLIYVETHKFDRIRSCDALGSFTGKQFRVSRQTALSLDEIKRSPRIAQLGHDFFPLTYRTSVRYKWNVSVYFMQSVILRARLESAFGERIPSPFTDLDRRVFENVPTGIATLDTLTGGIPRGAITEICGPPSSGRTSAMVSILAEANAQDEVCALVDGNNAFDPISAAAAGIDLTRLLWVRCRKLDEVLKSTDLLLQGGGFGRVVMDLTDLPVSHAQ